jgi:hypothetical protein
LVSAQPAQPSTKAGASTPAADDPIVVREAGPLPSPLALTYPPLGEVHIPKPVIIKLSNGMKVYLLENHDLPIVRAAL